MMFRLWFTLISSTAILLAGQSIASQPSEKVAIEKQNSNSSTETFRKKSKKKHPLSRSPHPRIHFVKVNNNVQLEVLDWGGTGKTVVLLAGGGDTAHVFDDFARKLATHYHVIGMTRRGFGVSTFSPVDRVSRFADDVLAVMNTLKLKRAFIVGHSLAGAELSALGAAHPERIAGLIYLEAGYPYAFPMPDGPSLKEFLDASNSGPRAPTPRQADLVSFAALQHWDARTFGFQMPESEFRQTWEASADGRPVRPRDAPGSASMMRLLFETTTGTSVQVPALVVFAIPHVHEIWMDARDLAAATAYFAKVDDLADRQARAIQQSLPNARVIRLRGMHYIFLSNAADVIREIRAFTARLK